MTLSIHLPKSQFTPHLNFHLGTEREFKSLLEEIKKEIVRSRKRQIRPSFQKPKRKKSITETDSSSTGSGSYNKCNQAELTNKIRRLIAK